MKSEDLYVGQLCMWIGGNVDHLILRGKKLLNGDIVRIRSLVTSTETLDSKTNLLNAKHEHTSAYIHGTIFQKNHGVQMAINPKILKEFKMNLRVGN